jgi:hypothetical protein
MYGGWKLFNPILLVEVEESLLISLVVSMHLQACGGEEKERNTRAHSPRLTGPGGSWHGVVW